MAVEVFHWNPVRPVLTGRLGRRMPLRRPVNNFGDLIGPMLVEKVVESRDLDPQAGRGRLLSVGSVLHFAHAGDVVWGSGVNGKVEGNPPHPLDIRAVRGPLTRGRLLEGGATVPEVYGDPALLWPRFWPSESYAAAEPAGVTIVPNFHDWPRWKGVAGAVNPRRPVHEVIACIANSTFVAGSSLHGVILAEAYGVPARFMRSGTEPSFKYEDYLGGTGRSDFTPADTIEQAIELGGQPPIEFDGDALLAAFPDDLWSPGDDAA